jgi:hypothetical protein
MHPIILFITNLENDKDKNIKMHHKLMAASIWAFALKIAEKQFIYGDAAIEYAKDILFIELHHDMQSVLNHIQQDFVNHKILCDNTQIYQIFMDSYMESRECLNKKENIDFYN